MKTPEALQDRTYPQHWYGRLDMKNGEKIYESIASIGGRSMIASFPVDAALPARIADVCADTRAPHPVKG